MGADRRRAPRPVRRARPARREGRPAGQPGLRPLLQHQPGAELWVGDEHPQAAAFGFPNPILGVAGFAVLLTIGVVLLTGAYLPRWFWWGIQAGTTFGVLFVHWLIFQSLYRIGALCPYCMLVWVAAITAFVATTSHSIRTGRLPLPVRLRAAAAYAPTVVTAWLVAIAALATVRFWDYWSSVVG